MGQTGLPSFIIGNIRSVSDDDIGGAVGAITSGVQPSVLVLIREPELPKSTTDLVQRVPLVVLMQLVVLLLAAEVQLPRCQLGHLAN